MGYYVFGFLGLVFLIVVITCAEATVVMVYFQLVNLDYNWWWRSFLTGASYCVVLRVLHLLLLRRALHPRLVELRVVLRLHSDGLVLLRGHDRHHRLPRGIHVRQQDLLVDQGRLG